MQTKIQEMSNNSQRQMKQYALLPINMFSFVTGDKVKNIVYPFPNINFLHSMYKLIVLCNESRSSISCRRKGREENPTISD